MFTYIAFVRIQESEIAVLTVFMGIINIGYTLCTYIHTLVIKLCIN